MKYVKSRHNHNSKKYWQHPVVRDEAIYPKTARGSLDQSQPEFRWQDYLYLEIDTSFRCIINSITRINYTFFVWLTTNF